METAVWITEIALLILPGFFLAYMMALSILALFGGEKKDLTARRSRVFAVVVPAHNEELVIARTLRSLSAMEYDKRLFDVVVVADNCTDETADLARSAGAAVLERHDPDHRGKGYALRWCFDRILAPGSRYDAVVVVDADTEISENFLQAINRYLEDGAKVIQAADVVLPQPGAWSPEVTRIALLLFNYVRPLGRRVIGCSAGLRGNGMCFLSEVLRKNPWDAYSLTEDLEYGLKLLLRGVHVTFAPEAMVYARMPEEAKNAESQRARWEGGRIPVVRAYAGQLLRTAVRKGSLVYLEALVDLIMPAFVNVLVISLGLLFVTTGLAAAGLEGADRFIVPWLCVVSMGVAYVLLGLGAARVERSAYKALFHLPRYAFWKFVLYLKLSVRGRPDQWVRTTREPPKAGSDLGRVA
ncbi:MAG: glycosyltransferase family 2 protein [Ignavibacteriales bacterium]|nr:glycosyltransferase family 2 protein [Ignavibacteriales bacterium]